MVSFSQYIKENPYAICGCLQNGHALIHTVGLTRSGHPEIFMVWDGVSEEFFETFVQVVDRVQSKQFQVNSEFHAFGRHLALTEVPKNAMPRIEEIVAHATPGTKFNAAQLVMDDENGHLPWENDYVETGCKQHLFGRQNLN